VAPAFRPRHIRCISDGHRRQGFQAKAFYCGQSAAASALHALHHGVHVGIAFSAPLCLRLIIRWHQCLVSRAYTGRNQRQIECGSSEIDANGVATAQIIGDGGLKTFDERPQAEAAAREQGVDIGARPVRYLPPLRRKVGEWNPFDIGIEY
jgi:hypothetical protein